MAETKKLFTLQEVAAYRDRDFIAESEDTVATNSITITLAASTGRRHYLQNITLAGTAGGGGAEAITVTSGSTGKWTGQFTIGTERDKPFYGMGLVCGEGEAVTIVASATALTHGTLSVTGFTK